MKTIICHVSDKRYDILRPRPPEDAICFSENTFITFFGQYLYLFDLDVMEENFFVRKVSTEGVIGLMQLMPEHTGYNQMRYESKPLGHEWRIHEPIQVDKFALGVVEHWNHMKGTIGVESVNHTMHEITVDLMRYKGELR